MDVSIVAEDTMSRICFFPDIASKELLVFLNGPEIKLQGNVRDSHNFHDSQKDQVLRIKSMKCLRQNVEGGVFILDSKV